MLRDTKGITIIDDWSGFGQRVTGSGTTLLDDVEVHPFSVFSFQALFDRPTPMGPCAQIMHAAVEQGIAEAALADSVHFVRASRPWRYAHVERASNDPYTVATVGELKIRVDASNALLERAGEFVDRAGRFYFRPRRNSAAPSVASKPVRPLPARQPPSAIEQRRQSPETSGDI